MVRGFTPGRAGRRAVGEQPGGGHVSLSHRERRTGDRRRPAVPVVGAATDVLQKSGGPARGEQPASRLHVTFYGTLVVSGQSCLLLATSYMTPCQTTYP